MLILNCYESTKIFLYIFNEINKTTSAIFQGRRGSEPNLAKRVNSEKGSTINNPVVPGVTVGTVQAAVANFNAITQLTKPIFSNEFSHFGSIGRSFSAHHMSSIKIPVVVVLASKYRVAGFVLLLAAFPVAFATSRRFSLSSTDISSR